MPPAETNGHRVLSNGHHPPITSREQAMGEALVLVKDHGYSVRQLADELTARGWKVGKTQAAELVKEARANEPFLDLLDRAEARVDQADRLRSYHQIMVQELRGGRTTGREFVETMLKVEDRWARLAGLDAPKQLRVEVEDNREVTPDFATLDALRDAVQEARARGREDEVAMLEGELDQREYLERYSQHQRIDNHHERLHEEDPGYNYADPPCMEYGCPLFEQARQAEIARTQEGD